MGEPDPVETICIAATAVTGEILARVQSEIGLVESLVIAIECSHHAGPGEIDTQISVDLVTFDGPAVLVHQ